MASRGDKGVALGELAEWPMEGPPAEHEDLHDEEQEEEEEEACPSTTEEEKPCGGLPRGAPCGGLPRGSLTPAEACPAAQGSQLALVPTPRMAICTSCNQNLPISSMTHLNNNRLSAKGEALKPVYRCRKCGSFLFLINKVLTRSAGMRGQWNEMPSDQKKLWLAKQHEELKDCTVDGVEKAMETHLCVTSEQTFSRKSNNTMKTKFNWFDEDELKEELKDKPKDLEQALKRAPRFVCDVFNKTMYGLPTYDSEQAERTDAAYESQMNYMKRTPEPAAAPPAKQPRISEATKSICIHQHTIFS